MASSKAATPQAYLAELPADRAPLISDVRDFVNSHIPEGYAERMNWGMISWEVPLETYPDTYNGQPLLFAALAAQKNYNALYLNCISPADGGNRPLKEAYAAAGKKLDMGRSCLRFKTRDQLVEDAIAEMIAAMPVALFIARYEARRSK
ncbi:DUF1801 domain-containing protein [Sphingosinicella rhizophila]|uniref:DUF1801 domain-containing protein n=1 Tax=Sphingosinicella rhizophila TaxID=3050082 RepID=A0ABU3Q6Z8_9SPHN|nr:DUF1801 domain-containing protein [Sphingosinicella sp. GR2756]MDT9599160.1 DUF1801 domain-containing protein [Sphingosinicella sp. GR2756]